MSGAGRLSGIILLTLGLAGCATYGPAPVSDLGKSYSSATRGEYRGSYYKVKQGDTLYFISYLTDKNVNDLITYNNLTPPYTIYPGQRINLWHPVYQAPQYGQPAPKLEAKPSSAPAINSSATIVAASVKNAPKAATTTANSTANIASVATSSPASLITKSIKNSKNAPNTQNIQNKSDPVKKVAVKPVEPSQAKAYGDSISKKNVNSNIRDTKSQQEQKVESWLWPTKGRVIGKFSAGDQGNKGIDIAGQRGQAIVATAAGSVVYSGNALRGYGNLIIIKHNDNYLSAYAHNAQLLVREGQNVIAGQKIATMGSSGTSSVKLHFEIRYQGKSVNPSRYLP